MSVVAGYRTSIAGTASGNIIPDADLTYTLGNASFRWLETFSGTYTFSGGQSLVGTTADVTTLARSTNNQLFVLGLATASYPAIGRNGTTLEVLLGSNNDYTGIKAKTLTLSASATTGIGAVNSNSIDLFSSGTPGRTGYFGTSVVIGNQTWSSSGNVITLVNSGSNFFSIDAGSVLAKYRSDAKFGFTSTTDSSSGSLDIVLSRTAASQLKLSNGAVTTGVTLDVGTDATLKLFARDGSSAATFQVGTVDLGSNSRLSSPSSGVIQYSLGDGTARLRLNTASSGIAEFLSSAGADTATVKANKLTITGLGAFAAGDKYVIVDASGNFHVSALGPAS